MTRLAMFKLDDSTSFLAEVDDNIESHKTMRGVNPVAKLVDEGVGDLETSLRNVRRMAEGIANRFKSLETSPEELTVEFGIKLSAEAGAVIAKTSGEASFSITLKWKRKSSDQE